MARPSVLLVDPESSRRREISHGLAGFGYEVIPAVGPDEGRRFAAGLGPGIVVLTAALARQLEGAVADLFPSPDPDNPRTLLILGDHSDDGRELPEEVLFLKVDGLPPADLVRRIHLVLLGREIGVEPDTDLESLGGDLALLPILELLRAANRARLTGRILSGEGELILQDGEVVAATMGRARGVKAFLRMSTLSAGPFWVRLHSIEGAEQDVRQDLVSLIFQALEDRVYDAPDPRARARVELGQAFFEARFTPGQQELLAVLPNCLTVGRLLDALPATDNEILRDLLGLREMGIVTLEEPEELVTVVTDSTSDLPLELARAHGIHVVPVLVLFGDRVYHDGVDLKAKEFYELLEKGQLVPRTNPVPEADFHDAYRALAPKKDVISVHISEKLSQTVVHARKAVAEGQSYYQELRGEAERVTIKVVD